MVLVCQAPNFPQKDWAGQKSEIFAGFLRYICVSNATALINAELRARPVRGFTLAEKTAGLNVVSLNALPTGLKERFVGKINASFQNAFGFTPKEILWDIRAKLPMLASFTFLPKLDEGLAQAMAALPVEITAVLDTATNKLYFLAEEENKRKIAGRLPERLVILTPEQAKQSMPPIDALVEIPGGRYKLGDDDSNQNDEKPEHIVAVDPFFIGVFSITNAQFKQAVKGGIYSTEKFWTAPGWQAKETNKWAQPRFWGDENYQRFNGNDQPVVGVSHHEAFAYLIWKSVQEGINPKDFLNGKFFDESLMYDRQNSSWLWAGYRLPTEAEREIAARGDLVGMEYSWGNAEPTAKLARFGLPWETGSPVAVNDAAFQPNNYGLRHMAGNVWEWTSDWYAQTYYEALARMEKAVNPTGPKNGSSRVIRGGSWGNAVDSLRVAYRLYFGPDDRDGYLGFRAARTKK